MKKTYKITSIFLASLLFLNYVSPVLNVSASEKEEITTKDLASQKQIESIAGQYIHFDSKSQEFKIDLENLKLVLSQEEVKIIVEQVNTTNEKIKSSLNDKNSEFSIYVVDSNNNKIALNENFSRKRGKNDIEFYWNFARIYIDGNNVRLALQAGFIIAGVNVTSGAVATVCGLLGLAAGEIKDGIWFDYNYFIGVLCGNYGWQ